MHASPLKSNDIHFDYNQKSFSESERVMNTLFCFGITCTDKLLNIRPGICIKKVNGFHLISCSDSRWFDPWRHVCGERPFESPMCWKLTTHVAVFPNDSSKDKISMSHELHLCSWALCIHCTLVCSHKLLLNMTVQDDSWLRWWRRHWGLSVSCVWTLLQHRISVSNSDLLY